MEKEKLTKEIFETILAKRVSENVYTLTFKQYIFTFHFYTMDKFWGIWFSNPMEPQVINASLPARVDTVDDLQNFWVAMTGEELEPLK